MGRKARIKTARRQERELLLAHPERQCGHVIAGQPPLGSEHHVPITERCPRAGRHAVDLQDGDVSYRASGEVRTDAGRAYTCDDHVGVFKASGHKVVRVV